MVILEAEIPITAILEKKAVEISIRGKKKKIATIEGLVTGVTGLEDKLHIHLDCTTYTHRINLIKFSGQSPVRKGDRIRAGLIVIPEFPKEAIFIGIYEDGTKPDYLKRFSRLDFMGGYNPLHVDTKKLGID